MATREVGNLRTRLAWEDDGAARSLTRFREDLKGLRSEMRTVTSQGKDYSNSLKGLRQQSDILTRQLKTQQDRVEELRKRYEESSRVKGEDAKQTRNLASQYNNAVAALNETEQQLKQVTDAIEEQTNPWKRLANQAESAGKTMQSVGQNLSNFGREYSMKVTAPIVASGGAVFKAAMDFESAFAGVAKTFSGTEEQLADLRNGIREMSKEIPASTTEISAVAEAAGQLGIKTESIEKFTRTMIDLGEATNMTADQAATEFARFANIVGMSQENFDRLGSSTVALGNSMATTEAEISSMAMRLAAQGNLVGMTEAQILALSATMSSLGIEAEAGGTAMTTVLKKIDQAVGEGGKSLQGFAKAAGSSSSEFSKAWQSDPIKALDMFIKGLSYSSKEGKNLTTILTDLGIKGIREADTILRMAGASDLLSSAVNTSTKAWKENTALSDEASQRYATTESQLRIMWNRVKDVAITLGESLSPAIMDALDAAEPFIKQIESGAKAFSELDEEQQRTILKMIAMVAAIGPASMALGGLTSGIGSVLKVGGTLVKFLGEKGGTGLLARIGGLGVSGPVGLAITGITGMGLAIQYLTKDTKDLYDASFEKVRQMNEEIQATDELISMFEELKRQNKLTSDEMLEYMDILDNLSSTSSPDKIAELTNRQNELLKKSGFTNAEMQEFLDINNKIIEQAPSTVSAISEQGNAYADNLQALKDLNAEKREEMMMEAEQQILEGLRDETELLAQQVELQRELNNAMNDQKSNHEAYMDSLFKQNELKAQINEIESKQMELLEQGYSMEGSKVQELQKQKAEIDDLLLQEEKRGEKAKEALDTVEKTVKTKEEELNKINEELKRLDDLKYEYEALWIAHLDLNAEKGKGIQAIDEEIARLRDSKKQMEQNTHESIKNTEEYRNAQKAIDNQIKKLQGAKSELEKINRLASETAYEKSINIKTQPTIARLDSDLSRPISKQVNLQSGPIAIRAYAEGTDHHPGGPFIAGEEGFELGRLGNRWEVLNAGLYDRPSGYQVFPHDESKRIIQALNGIPGYSDGVRPSGLTNQIIENINSPAPGKYAAYITVVNQVDSREISRETYKTDLEFSGLDEKVRDLFAT